MQPIVRPRSKPHRLTSNEDSNVAQPRPASSDWARLLVAGSLLVLAVLKFDLSQGRDVADHRALCVDH